MGIIDDSIMKGDSTTDNQLVSEDGSSIYLIPTPTSDPADPLNWHPVRKWAVLGLLLLWSSAALSIQSFLLNYLPSVAVRFPEADESQINLLCTVIMVMIAPGQLFFTPLAIAYGRRFSLLLANALLLVSSIWGALATSYNSLLAARIIEGFAAGPTDCMVYVMVQEFTFIHERGTR
jgi:MFS family permease